MAGRKLDELFWNLRADTKNLKADIQAAQSDLRTLDKAGRDAAEGVASIGSAAATAASKLKGASRVAKEGGGAIADQIIKGAEETLEARQGEIAAALQKGLVSEEEAARQGQRAGKAFNDGIRAATTELADLGVLTPGLEARLTRSLKSDAAGALRALETEFQVGVGRARLKLADGLIDEKAFEREGREAAEKFNRGVRAEIRRLGKEGRLTEAEFARLSSSLKRVGQEGEKAGKRSALSFRNMRLAIASVAAFVAGSRIVQFFRESVRSAADLQRSFLKLAAGAKLFGVEQATLNRLAEEGRKDFALTATEANEIAVVLAKIAARAGDVNLAFEALPRVLDLAAAQGLSAADASLALDQALRGIDEGTDKLLQKNPSQIFEEFAASLGKSAAKLTDAEQKQALLNAVIEAGGRVQGEYGRFLETNIGQLSEWDRLLRRGREAVGNLLIPVLARLADLLDGALRKGVDVIERMADSIDRITTSPLERLRRELQGVAADSREAALALTVTMGRALESEIAALEAARTRVTLSREAAEALEPPGRRFPFGLAPGEGIFGLPDIRPGTITFDVSAAGLAELKQGITDADQALDDLLQRQLDAAAAGQRASESRIQALRDEIKAAKQGFEGEIERREKLTEKTQEEIENLRTLEALRRGETIAPPAEPTPPEPPLTGPFTKEEIEAAQGRLGELQAQLEELRRAGADFVLLEDAPGALQAAVGEVIGLRAEITGLEADLVTAGGASEEVLDALARKREQLAEARARAADLADSPEGRIAEVALEAGRNLDDLLEARRRLADLGLGLEAAPPQLLEVFDRIGENEATIERVADLIGDLAAEDAELAREGVALIETLRRENAELALLAGTLGDVGAILQDFPDLEASVFKGLGPEDSAELRTGLEGIQAALQAVEAARLEVDIAALGDDKKRAEQAAKALAAAERRLQQTLSQVAAAVEASNLPLEKKAELLKLIASLSGDAGDKSRSLAKTLSTFEGLARGVLSVADAMGVLSDNARRALQGVIDVAAGIGRIGADPIGGTAQLLGGVVGLVSGLFGENPQEKARRQALRENTAALDRLRASLDRQEKLVSGLTGEQLLALDEFIRTASVVFTERGGGARVTTAGAEGETFLETLRRFGLTLDDLEAVAGAAGISVENLVGIIEGTGGDIRLAAAEWEAFIQAVRDGTASLGVLEDEFSEKMAVLQDRMRAFPDLFDTAIERAEALVAVFASELPEGIRQELLSFDLSSAEGRRQAISFLQELLERRLDPKALGGLTVDEFRGGIADLIEAIGEAAEEGAAIGGETDQGLLFRKAITEIQANIIIGVLTTISVVLQQILAVESEQLRELGGTVPENVEVISVFRGEKDLDDVVGLDEQRNILLEGMLTLDEARNALLASIEQRLAVPGTMLENGLSPPPRNGGGGGITNHIVVEEISVHGTEPVTDPQGTAVTISRELVDELSIELARRNADLVRARGGFL